jgi:hypothetical protein
MSSSPANPNESDSPNAMPNDPDHNPAPRDDTSDLLDLLFAEGFDRERAERDLAALPAERRTRGERLLRLVEGLDRHEVVLDDADTLVAATLARVAAEDEARDERMRFSSEHAALRHRRRLADMVAVASVAILATSVLVPLANWSSGRALDARCANNLRLVSSGLAHYVADNGALPMAAGFSPGAIVEWSRFRHASNLRTLIGSHYCSADCLRCPGDDDADACYAYRVPTSEASLRPDLEPTAIVVGDRNPLIDLCRRGSQIVRVTLNSASHGGRGQNVLRADGTIVFLTDPRISSADAPNAPSDNIWLPFGNEPSSLLNRPGRVEDVFLVH